MGGNGKSADRASIDEQNAIAVLETLKHWQEVNDKRFASMENEIATLKDLVQKQTQTLGTVFQQMMGTGSTVRDDGDHR
jgi:hypothetical protein